MIRKILFAVSLALNVITILFFSFALSRRTTSISFYEPAEPSEQFTAAVLASVPAGSASIVFTTVELSLNKGETAALQFSAVSRNRQANLLITALYDRQIVAVSPTGYGILITALQPGETVLQTLGDNGFQDIARITVTE